MTVRVVVFLLGAGAIVAGLVCLDRYLIALGRAARETRYGLARRREAWMLTPNDGITPVRPGTRAPTRQRGPHASR